MKSILIEPKENFKQVYSLRLELENDNAHMLKVQSLTLDESRPLLGLKGRKGLFGSTKWWENIRNKKMRDKVTVNLSLNHNSNEISKLSP